jgi:hypothetical protein
MAGLCGFSLADQPRSWTPSSSRLVLEHIGCVPVRHNTASRNMRACGVPEGINLLSNLTTPQALAETPRRRQRGMQLMCLARRKLGYLLCT